jgi:hypothetical protein
MAKHTRNLYDQYYINKNVIQIRKFNIEPLFSPVCKIAKSYC